MNTYLAGDLLLLCLWLWIYAYTPMRKKMLLMGAVFVVLAWVYGGYLGPVDYWRPPYINKLLRIEDLLWCAAYCGIVISFPADPRTHGVHGVHHYPFMALCVGATALAFVLWLCYPVVNSIYVCIVPPILIGVVGWVISRDRRVLRNTLVSALGSMLLIFAWYQILLVFDPQFIQKHWLHENLIGLYVLQVPVEELIFGFSIGFGRYAYEIASGKIPRAAARGR